MQYKSNVKKSRPAVVCDPRANKACPACDIFSSLCYIIFENEKQKKQFQSSLPYFYCRFLFGENRSCLASFLFHKMKAIILWKSASEVQEMSNGRKKNFLWFLLTIEALLSLKKLYLYKTMNIKLLQLQLQTV